MILKKSMTKTQWVMLWIALVILLADSSVLFFKVLQPLPQGALIGFLLDFIIVIPFLFYFSVVHKRRSKLTILPFIFYGMWLSYFLIPHHQLPVLTYGPKVATVVIALVELLLLIKFIQKWPILKGNFIEARKQESYMSNVIFNALTTTFPKHNAVKWLAVDLATLYYSLFSWRKSYLENEGEQAITIHKNTGFTGCVFMLIHAMLIEIIGVHVLVSQWSESVAWIVTALDIYGLLFILAYFRATLLSPVLLKASSIVIPRGVIPAVSIPFDHIASIQKNVLTSKECRKQKSALVVEVLEFVQEDPQFVIKLKTPIYKEAIFGKGKWISEVYIRVDQPQMFQPLLEQHCHK